MFGVLLSSTAASSPNADFESARSTSEVNASAAYQLAVVLPLYLPSACARGLLDWVSRFSVGADPAMGYPPHPGAVQLAGRFLRVGLLEYNRNLDECEHV